MSKQEAKGMFDLITYLLLTNPYSDRNEKIHDLLVSEIRLKLRNKLERRVQNHGYSITVSEVQALALEEWMILQRSFIPIGNFVYELNEATKITNEINYIYG
ncbi:hypothetical protein [Pedobacter sp. NJ-S-72]